MAEAPELRLLKKKDGSIVLQYLYCVTLNVDNEEVEVWEDLPTVEEE